jgi:hypothetical protein
MCINFFLLGESFYQCMAKQATLVGAASSTNDLTARSQNVNQFRVLRVRPYPKPEQAPVLLHWLSSRSAVLVTLRGRLNTFYIHSFRPLYEGPSDLRS